MNSSCLLWGLFKIDHSASKADDSRLQNSTASVIGRLIYTYLHCILLSILVFLSVNFIFTLREANVYKPHGFFLGFLATFICFCVTVLFYRYLYFVVNQIKLQVIEKLKFDALLLAQTICE